MTKFEEIVRNTLGDLVLQNAKHLAERDGIAAALADKTKEAEMLKTQLAEYLPQAPADDTADGPR